MSPTEDGTMYRTIYHSTIGPLRGIKSSAMVTQYLGVQYATLKDRFSRGELRQTLPSEDICSSGSALDATEHGPIPLNPPDGCEWEQLLIQKTLPFSPFRQSDTQGLTLNIAASDFDGVNRFPVLVFVHGGGFVTGSSTYPQYDLALFTQMSVETRAPIISVGVNYRTGITGFLHSSMMESHGYKPNNGLDDQRLALRWIKDNIAGFGGDPNRVTFVGESAGGASGWFHLQSPEPLFHQIVAMSGTSFLRPRDPQAMENCFNIVAGMLDAKQIPPEKQLQRLLKTPKEDLMADVGRRIPIGPMLDDDLIRAMSTFKSLGSEEDLQKLFPAINHCKRILIGDCELDGMAFYGRIAARTDILPVTLAGCLSTVFDPIDVKITPAIISAYELDKSATSNTKYTITPVLDFASDILFSLPARSLVRSWSTSAIPGTEAFLYHFNCPNPWDGPWKGHATHAQDIMFVLQNYSNHLSLGQRKCSERFARDIITFVGGTEPWPAYQDGFRPGSMVYYAPMDGDRDESTFVVQTPSEQTRRDQVLLEIVTESLFDNLIDAWQMFMLGSQQL